jgi:hypothetical protein
MGLPGMIGDVGIRTSGIGVAVDFRAMDVPPGNYRPPNFLM